MIRAAVIGLGDISSVHISVLQAMSDTVEICAACDLDEQKASRLPGTAFYTDYVQMMEQEKPDCVHLCLPHDLHYPVAKAAAERGIHVFTEKPLALCTEQAEAFARLEQEHPELRIGVCLQNRYNLTTQKLRELLAQQPDDPVRNVRGVVIWSRSKAYYDASPWRAELRRAGGGVLQNQSIHTLDLMAYLGGPVASIRGEILNLLDYGMDVEDTATARLEYQSGAMGLFYATVAHGENTSVELDISTAHTHYRIRDEKLFRVENGVEALLAEDPQIQSGRGYWGSSHGRVIHSFYEALSGRAGDYPHAADGVYSLRMIDAIRRSSECKTAVRL